MGQGTSRIQQPGCQYDDHFLILFNPTENQVEFDTTQSRLVCFAINHQSHQKFNAKSLGRTVVNDAKLISETFVQIGAVTEGNTAIHVATENPGNCTFEGMRRCFIDAAKSVGAEGLFVFHFSGHGIQIGDYQFGLAPSDFDYSYSTYITARVLNDWLTEASCKAKHALFTLDCCHAGGITDSLTSVILHRSLFVASACTANESSYVVGTLGHSMFSYFLADATRKQTSDPRKLPLCNILTECRTCCKALSSLLVKYEAPGRVASCQIDPELITFTGGTQSYSDDETDGVHKFILYLAKHYDLKYPVLPLHTETKRWLNSIVESITTLRGRDHLTGKVLVTAMCSVMMSIASYQLAFEPKSVSNPNTFITAFLKMASFFDLHCPGFDLSIDHFRCSWEYYIYVLQKNAVDDASIKALGITILKENNASMDEDDECDGGQNEVRLHGCQCVWSIDGSFCMMCVGYNYVNVLMSLHIIPS